MANQENGGLSSAARLAQGAHAVASVLNGAITGGLHGAAIGAAKAFAPQILKLVACTLILIIFLPIFLFLSLVGTNFQFPSVDDSDVVKMNEQAALVGGLYGQFGAFTQNETDAVIARLSAGYDDVVASKNLGNINNYWVAAISSVLNNQDLYRVSEASVRQLAQSNIEYNFHVETYYDSDDEEESNPHYRAHIDTWDTGAAALMQKLHFTDFQIQWATFLYQNLAEMQTLDPNSPGYDGDMPGVNLDDITFTDGSTEVVYYNQMDSDWCNAAYGKTQTIGVAGCGPTALAMVVSSLTGTQMDPKEMADWAYKQGYCCEGDGSYRTLIPEGAAAFGLSVTGAGRGDAQTIVDALSAGKLVVAIMGPGHFTTAGHFIVLRGVTAEGKLLVADPVSYGKSQQEWDTDIVLNEASRSNAAGGPLWIIG